MTAKLIGKIFQGPKTEIGLFENREKVSAVIKIKIINSRLYACLYQEWMGSAKDPYFESNFVGAYINNSNLKLLGLGTLESPTDSNKALLNIDFRHPFVDIKFPYLLVESPSRSSSVQETWENYIIN